MSPGRWFGATVSRPALAALGLWAVVGLVPGEACAQWQGPRAEATYVASDGTVLEVEAPEGRFRPSVAFLAELTLSFGNLGGGGFIGEYLVLSPVFRGYWRFADHFAVSVDWGLAFETNDDERVYGNPFLAGHYLLDLRDGTLRVGLGVALPTADGETDPDAYITGTAVTSRVGYEGYLFFPETLAMLVPIRIETVTAILFAAELTAGVLVPTGGEADGTSPRSSRSSVSWAPSSTTQTSGCG